MAVINGTIRCSGCKEWCPLDSFAPSFAARGRGRCRSCHNKYGAAWMKSASPEARQKIQDVRRAYYLKIKESKKHQDKARRESPDWREKRREWVLKASYGITAQEYAQILDRQGGGCACCGAASNDNGKRLFVDHCHITGKVRGILCGKCNTGIGNLGDNASGVQRALEYLQPSALPLLSFAF